MIKNKEHLTVLNEAEYAAFYETPDFDEHQRYEYLTLTPQELDIAISRRGLSNQIFCCIQIGYFKAVNLFFGKDCSKINKDDTDFIVQQYFNNCTVSHQEITKHEYYTQCNAIMQIFGYESIMLSIYSKFQKFLRFTHRTPISTPYYILN